MFMKHCSGSVLIVTLSILLLLLAICGDSKKDTNTPKHAEFVKFKWYDNITAEKVSISDIDKNPNPKTHLIERNVIYKKSNGTLILQGTNFSSEYPDAIAWTPSAGFVDTVFYSYQKHHNLVIRPDDVWTAIIVQFSRYVNANAEKLRHSFVNFQGKKSLEVTFVAPVDQVPIDEFVTKILGLINENIDTSVSNWILPNFTTTTENDKLTAGVALMATLQNYFEYTLATILCGIPEVTILGSLEDWKNIRHRVEKLKEFEVNGKNTMEMWSSMLGRILDQFINVKEGKEKDVEFWRQAIRVDYRILNLGCARINETYLNGWITTFSAFDKKGKWQDSYQNDYDDSGETTDQQKSTKNENSKNKTAWLSIKTNKITPGVVEVPIKISDAYAKPEEKEYTGSIFTGHLGYAVQKDGKTIQPLSGWAMAITNNPPEYLRYKIPKN